MCRFGQQIVLPFLLGWILCILILFEMLSQTIEPTAPVVDVDVMGKNYTGWRWQFPRKYQWHELHRWREAPITRSVRRLPGEMGKPVYTLAAMEQQMKDTFELNQFNLVVSDLLALNRSLPDTRNPKTNAKYLPTTSIIIVFHNEAWSTLLRTVWSIVHRSPSKLLKEIILVDDASDREWLGQKLDDYVKTLSVHTVVLRSGSRNGIVNARLLGVKYATGQVLTFMDSHCECNVGWLEPLLTRIVHDRSIVVCPVIDSISYETFAYRRFSDHLWGGFSWGLNFDWYDVPDRVEKQRNFDVTTPLRTPVMAGGLFSIDRKFFAEIGMYDEGMKIWGAENLEFSFRIWMCGGQLEIIPCSRVGHVFRKNSPHSFPGGGPTSVIYRNTMRLVDAWLDEWSQLYYTAVPRSMRETVGDLTQRMALRKRLNCQSFRWYLENVYPESAFPLDYYTFGEILNTESFECLDTVYRKKDDLLASNPCHFDIISQLFAYTKNQRIMTDKNICLEATKSWGGLIKLGVCKDSKDNQKWKYDVTDKYFVHIKSGNCLTAALRNDPHTPVLEPCNQSTGQKWLLRSRLPADLQILNKY